MPKRNNRRKFKKPPRNREVQLKSKDQEYAIIVEAFGDYRFLVNVMMVLKELGESEDHYEVVSLSFEKIMS